MSDTIRRPPIPATAGVKDFESLRRFLEPVKMLLEIHEGWRGRAGIDRFVPEGELSTIFNRVASMDVSEFIGNDTDPPDPPTDMLVVANVWGNLITWTNPTSADLSHIEIWVNTVDAVTEATLVGVVTVPRSEIGGPGQYMHFPSDLNDDHYYWIRAVDWSGNYSTWVPTEEQGGFLAPAQNTVGETIDKVMEILLGNQPVYSAWDIATTYEAGNRVVHDGRTWECYNAVTGVAPTDATGLNYWFRVGILIEGDVDGIPTVGIDGNAVVDGTLLARSIKTDELVAGGNVQIADGSITIAGLATATGNWIEGIEDLADDAYDLADGKITVFRQTGIPTSISVGDLWVDTDNGNKLYRAGMKGANEIKAGEWVEVQDAGATYALLGLNSAGRITKAVQTSLMSALDVPTDVGLWISNARIGYYNGTGGTDGWPVYIKNDGKFWFGKDTSNYFAYDGSNLVFATGEANGLRILGGGSLHIYDGGDIIMRTGSSDSGLLQWDASYGSFGNLQANIQQSWSTGNLNFWKTGSIPVTSANGGVIFGATPGGTVSRFGLFTVYTQYDITLNSNDDINLTAADEIPLTAGGDISLNPGGGIVCGANITLPSSGVITGSTAVNLSGGGSNYFFAAPAFYVNNKTTKTINNGHSARAWNNTYSYAYPTVADFFFLDSRRTPEGEVVAVDDIGAIFSIKGSGKHDPVTGLELIDDNTIPDWLIHRYDRDEPDIDRAGVVHRAGEPVFDPLGRPYLDLKTMISLLMGASRQLDTKIENILEILRDNNLVSGRGHGPG